MHYDEYEISMDKEINFCRRVVKRLKTDLLKMEQRYGMTTQQFLDSSQEALPADNRDMARWCGDHRQQRIWEQRMQEYEKALAMVKRQS